MPPAGLVAPNQIVGGVDRRHIQPARQIAPDGPGGFGQLEKRELDDILNVVNMGKPTPSRRVNEILILFDKLTKSLGIPTLGVLVQCLLVRHRAPRLPELP